MSFANPAGFYALLAWPVIVLIHCLQQRSRRLRVSTLFLLQRIAPESVSGSRLDRLRTSLPFWMQMLAAGLIAWLLAQPRWQRVDSAQTVVLIMDSSASMSAHRPAALEAVRENMRRWEATAAQTHWHLIESDPKRPTLYAGPSREAALASLDQWQPVKGQHALADALATARGLLRGGSGGVTFVTDHSEGQDLPSDVSLLAVGEKLANVGWSGLRVDRQFRWQALLTNHSDAVQTREWWIAHELAPQPTHQSATLQPRQTLQLSGELPGQVSTATLHLSPDDFTLDDQAPLLRPQTVPVRVDMALSGEAGLMVKDMLSVLDDVQFVALGEKADLTISEIGSQPSTHAVLIDFPVEPSTTIDPTPVIAEPHELLRDVTWAGLITHRPTAMKVLSTDSPLLWRGEHPLALLRPITSDKGPTVQHLYLNWDVARSNARRLPAMLVMLQRFIESLRNDLPGVRALNLDTAQSVSLPASLQQAKLSLRLGDVVSAYQGQAPDRPSLFTLEQDKQVVLRGAAAFADAREADLSKNDTADTTAALQQEAQQRHTEADPLTPLWLMLVLGALLVSWHRKGGMTV